MKRKILITMFLTLLFIPALAQECGSCCNKHYCSVDQIEISDAMILVHFEGEVFELDSIKVDQGGVYFLEEAMRCTNCRKTINPKNTCECPKTSPYLR